jgi:hypothetical protein
MMDPRDMFNGRNNDGWGIIILETSFLHFIPGKSKLIIHQDLGCKFSLLGPQELVLEDSKFIHMVLGELFARYSGSKNCPHVLTFFTIYNIV